MPTALLGAVLLVCCIGVGYKCAGRIREMRSISSLRASLDGANANVVVIRRKATPTPDIPVALPMPALTPAHTPAPTPTRSPTPTPTPTPTPSADPELQRMMDRMDNLRALSKQNDELIGWITIPDTRIDYPVMYSPDRVWFYLDHDFDGKSSKSGLPFLDESCKPTKNRRNLLVYGHNMKDGSMFAGLHSFKDPKYYAAHRTLYYITPSETARYEIVAVALVDVTENSPCKFFLYTNIADDAAFAEYVHIIKEASLYPDDMDAGAGDELITLCTCAKHQAPERLIVVAKRVRG